MTEKRQFDLVERCHEFAVQVRTLIRKLPRTICNISDAKQLVRSSGSIGANYIEANEALSKRDFAHRLRIARKEAKETIFWLRLLYLENEPELDRLRTDLVREAHELMLILTSIIRKVSGDSEKDGRDAG